MEKHITDVAFDMHQDSITAAWLLPNATTPEVRRIPHEAKTFHRLVRQLLTHGPARACYEAGPCGYAPQRYLVSWGLPCEVVAPALTPRRPGVRIKTDRRDAVKLVRLYRAGELTTIRVPTPAEEARRDLLRCREACGADLLRAKHRLTKCLLRQGLRCPTGSPWSQAWWTWVQALRLPDPVAQRTLEEYLVTVTTLQGRRKALEAEVLALATVEPWAPAVARLRCLHGIDTLSAVTLVGEVLDFHRFGAPRPLMSFVGLVPSEASSGPRERRGWITKTGNAHLRRILVEAAWHYRHRPRVSARLQACRAGQPPRVIAVAQQAQERLHRRFGRLLARGKPAPVVVTAVARELCGFIWALMVEAPAA